MMMNDPSMNPGPSFPNPCICPVCKSHRKWTQVDVKGVGIVSGYFCEKCRRLFNA